MLVLLASDCECSKFPLTGGGATNVRPTNVRCCGRFNPTLPIPWEFGHWDSQQGGRIQRLHVDIFTYDLKSGGFEFGVCLGHRGKQGRYAR